MTPRHFRRLRRRFEADGDGVVVHGLRERRAVLGELCQWDSSIHAWLKDRGPGDLTVISIHDDATSRLQTARFVERDNGAEKPSGGDRVPAAGEDISIVAHHRTFLLWLDMRSDTGLACSLACS